MEHNKLFIASVASEVAPFSKSGGMGDVVRSLSNHLSDMKHRVAIFTPRYGFMKKNPELEGAETLFEKEMIVVGKNTYSVKYKRIKETDNREFIMVCNEDFFGGRSKMYSYDDDNARFLLFAKAVLRYFQLTGDAPDIIHCHDWHAAALPNVLKSRASEYPALAQCATVFTIHNLAFQMRGRWWEIPEDKRDDGKGEIPEGVRELSRANLARRAIRNATVINAVSERYAQEILTPKFGQGMDKLLLKRQDDVYGIINGIDYNVSNPLFDKNIKSNYDWNSLNKKEPNKTDLQKTFGLEQDASIPIIGMVNRLTEQKGFDLIREIMWVLEKMPLQMVVVGSGDREYIQFFRKEAKKFPKKISVSSPFTHDMESKVYAGSDMFLMPSRYEPCGISQMKSLRYGSIPIVHETGGLSDTIENFNPKTGRGNGFVFQNYAKEGLLVAITRAIETYEYPYTWTHLVWKAMQLSYSWELPAKKYVNLYKIAIKKHRSDEKKNGK